MTWHFPRDAFASGSRESPRKVESNRELESFLRGVATRAFRIARLSLRDDADAFDAVQEAMIRLARRYGDRPADEWTPLFYAILRNCVNDELRGRRSRGSLLQWVMRLGGTDSTDGEVAGMSQAPLQPAREFESEQRLRELDLAIRRLPARQREAFLLRNVEELDVSATARAMGCSEGSVKTHYSRAVHALRDLLGEP
jgi:RNA polymerase sigma-70 factor (ECF subfamily)